MLPAQPVFQIPAVARHTPVDWLRQRQALASGLVRPRAFAAASPWRSERHASARSASRSEACAGGEQIRGRALHHEIGATEAAMRQLHGTEFLDEFRLHLMLTVCCQNHVFRADSQSDRRARCSTRKGRRPQHDALGERRPLGLDSRLEQVHRGDPMKLATNRVSGRS